LGKTDRGIKGKSLKGKGRKRKYNLKGKIEKERKIKT
jgi:hypothetical protein